MAATTAGANRAFFNQLRKYYTWYTGGFLIFLFLIAIAEQLGLSRQYIGYAFIPRFIWPEKPIIAKGAWYAWRIGQANITPTGAYTNSVNMTVAGELYLNFGWLGVLLGCLSFGIALGTFWARTGFWVDESNTLGSAFGFYLLWIGLGLAADLQIIVTLVATYLLFVAIGYMLPSLVARYPGSSALIRSQ